MFDVQALRDAADEIEACGGGSEAALMRAAADEIKRLRSTPRWEQSEVDAMARGASPMVSASRAGQ